MRSMYLPAIVALLASVAAGSFLSADEHTRGLQTVDDLEVTAYQCNTKNEQISDSIKVGDPVRVCVETARRTKLLDIHILKINTFRFYKRETARTLRQDAIDGGAEVTNGRTTIECVAGSDICALNTVLDDQFFESDGEVEGIGTVAMQSGGGQTRKLQIRYGRQLQDFAGITGASMTFKVEDGFNQRDDDGDQSAFQRHWNSQPDHIQALYISAVFVAALLLCCICAGMILWKKCCADVPGEWLRRVHVEDDLEKDDLSITHSVEEYEEQYDSEGQEQSTREMLEDDEESSSEESSDEESSFADTSRQTATDASTRELLTNGEDEKSVYSSSNREIKEVS